MTIFYCEDPIFRGKTDKQFLRACGDSIREMKNFASRWRVERVSLELPPVVNTASSKRVPRLVLPHEQRAPVLIRNRAVAVPENYLYALYWMRKLEFIREWSSDPVMKATLERANQVLSAKVRDLIFSGQVVRETESSEILKLNQQLEKIDLGRYKGLNLYSDPSESHLKMRGNFVGAERREAQAQEKLDHQYSLQHEEEEELPVIVSEEETPFQRAMRERREKGLEGY